MLPYIAVARLTAVVKRSCTGFKEWSALDENYAVGKIWVQLHGWTTAFRGVAQASERGNSADGRLLLEGPGYMYHIFLIYCCDLAGIISLGYNG